MSDTTCPNEIKFIECAQNCNFEQLINKPTRHRLGQKSNILDLVFTSDIKDILEVEHLMPLGCSDHEILSISLDLPTQTSNYQSTKLNFNKMDTDKFLNYLKDVDWSVLDKLNCLYCLKLLICYAKCNTCKYSF